ncbi:MAG TPA: PepSY-like domain-containing protein, partial [Puia sp.]
MIRLLSYLSLICCSTAFFFSVESCNRELSSPNTNSSNNTSSHSTTIALALDSDVNDSIYIMQPCARGYFRDSVAASALPANVNSYLSSNYIGYTFIKAYGIKDSAGNIGGYVAIINYNGKPVAILFDGTGAFVRVLEQRERGDEDNDGWHRGGRYCDRDPNERGRDTISLISLPASILSYVATNYPNDSLEKAYINIDSSYLVISEDSGLYATLFNSAGDFVKRVQLYSRGPVSQHVDLAALPASAQTYLNSTYPNHVFEKAFSFTVNGVLQGYIVVIDANNTKYAVEFDASGNFIGAITIW